MKREDIKRHTLEVLKLPETEKLKAKLDKYRARLDTALNQGRAREVRRRTTEVHILETLLKNHVKKTLTKRLTPSDTVSTF